MAMKMDIVFVVVLCVLGLTESYDASPYSITLQHESGCEVYDAEQDATCCDSLQIDILQMKIIFSNLKKQLDGLEHSIGPGSNKYTLTSILSLNGTSRLQALLNAIAQKDAEIQSTQSEIASTESGIRAIGSALVVQERQINETTAVLQSVREKSNALVAVLVDEAGNITQDANVCEQELQQQGSIWNIMSHFGPHGPTTLTYCSFGNQQASTCGFTQARPGDGDDMDWTLHKGSPDASTGPKMDHTFGTPKGYYMYLDAKVNAGSSSGHHVARMSSASLEPAPTYCLMFWYNMNGQDVKDLLVYAQKVGGGRGYPVWSQKGNHGPDWQLATIELDSEYTGHPFQIVFEGSHDAYYRRSSSHGHYTNTYYYDKAGMALDDIYIYNTTCQKVATCPPGSHTWHRNGSSTCYTFHTVVQTWYDSYQTCRKNGAHSHLVSIDSKEEQNYIVNLIQGDAALRIAGVDGWYTAGNDEDKEHTFVWTETGSPYPAKYTNWYPGQPNNVGNNQDCLLLQYADSNYEWGDIDCDEPHPYICEVDL